MCSISDLQRALAEVKRVLVAGGRLCFMEHGRSPVPRIARWQRRINPFYSPISGGCRLDLRVAEAVREAGFEIVNIDSFELGKKPGLATHIVRGVAIKT